MPAPLTIDRELVKALFIQGFTAGQISNKVGVNPKTVETWANRFKWRLLLAKTSKKLEEPLNRLLANSLTAHSENARLMLAESITTQAKALATKQVTFGMLRNTPDGQGLAAVTKTIAESAALVHGWGSEKAGTIIVVDDLRSFDQETKPAQVTDVQDVK